MTWDSNKMSSIFFCACYYQVFWFNSCYDFYFEEYSQVESFEMLAKSTKLVHYIDGTGQDIKEADPRHEIYHHLK